MPIPFMEVETAWARVLAYQAPAGMDEASFYQAMDSAKMFDMSVPFSVRSPQWANYEPLSVKYFKQVGGAYFGMARNGSICNASIHLATHMDGEKHFYPAGRTIGQVPLDEWVGPGVVADISSMVSNSSVYTPEMIEKVVDIHEGDILIIKTGWYKFGWNSPDSDEFRYMIKHPGPSPDFAEWAAKLKLKWIGVDCVAADHPMNTIQRIWHPKTFEEANEKLKRDFGKDWDEMYPLDQYYQDMHLNLFPKKIVHAENLGLELADVPSGRYYIGCFVQKAMEVEVDVGPFRGLPGRLDIDSPCSSHAKGAAGTFSKITGMALLSELENYQSRIEDLHRQINTLISRVPLDGLNWRPLDEQTGDETNSLALLARHIAGAEHFWIGEVLGALPTTRDRDAEFKSAAGSVDELIQLLDRTLVESIEILSHPDIDLEKEFLVREKIVPARWAILHVIDHTSLHLGHMQITYQLWFHGKAVVVPTWDQRLPDQH